MATSNSSALESPPLEVSVSKAALLKELSITQSVVERKSSIPILGNFMFEAASNHLLITATDLELSLRTFCPAQVKQQGSCTVPARKLYEYIRLLADGEITIKSLENDWVQIRSGRSHTKMVGLPRKDFPGLPLYPADSAIRLPVEVLRRVISRTIFAISQEPSRYTLNGALLILRPDTITMIATDGHRLAYIQAKAELGLKAEMRVLIPKKALAEINSLLGLSGVNEFEFAKDQSNLFFRIGTRLLTSRQLTGTFPNYEAVMPREYPGSLVVPTDEFAQAVQRVAQFSDERSNAVRVKAESNQLCLSSSSAETGESEEHLDVSYSGSPIKIGFNARYLIDFMKVAAGEKLTFHFKESSSAAEFRPLDGTNGDYAYRYILMPMRV